MVNQAAKTTEKEPNIEEIFDTEYNLTSKHGPVVAELDKKRMTEMDVASQIQKKGLHYSKQEMRKSTKRPKSSAQDYTRQRELGFQNSTQFVISSDLLEQPKGTGTVDTSYIGSN